jgi:hypothetical protein
VTSVLNDLRFWKKLGISKRESFVSAVLPKWQPTLKMSQHPSATQSEALASFTAFRALEATN